MEGVCNYLSTKSLDIWSNVANKHSSYLKQIIENNSNMDEFMNYCEGIDTISIYREDRLVWNMSIGKSENRDALKDLYSHIIYSCQLSNKTNSLENLNTEKLKQLQTSYSELSDILNCNKKSFAYYAYENDFNSIASQNSQDDLKNVLESIDNILGKTFSS